MREILDIFIVSIKIVLISAFISFVISFFISFLILEKKLKFLYFFFQSFLFVPSVLLGLLIYIFFKRNGVLGFLDLLYTSKIVIIGETILIIPLMVLFIINGIKDKFYEIEEINKVFGGNLLKNLVLIIRECKSELFSSFVIGCGRVIGETGLAMVVGGNIKGETRTFSTSIVLFTMRGEVEKSIYVGILLFIFSLIFVFLYFLFSRDGDIFKKY
jgi:tungstate transport system permease protein